MNDAIEVGARTIPQFACLCANCGASFVADSRSAALEDRAQHLNSDGCAWHLRDEVVVAAAALMAASDCPCDGIHTVDSKSRERLRLALEKLAEASK